MIEPKPLTKEERATIERLQRDSRSKWPHPDPWIERLLAAEQFWREAVRDVHPGSYCAFCKGHYSMLHSMHRPECPWLLSQDELMKENS